MIRVFLFLFLVLPLFPLREARAACNLIPGTEKTFAGEVGALNRPYAAPGESVEVRLRACDGTSPGLAPAGGDHVVTVLFRPPLGPPHAVILSDTPACPGLDLAGCEVQLGGGTATCISGPEAGLAVVDRNGTPRLRFRFPDTDVLRDGVDDDQPYSGAATVVVTGSADPLACGVATTGCPHDAGLVACIDTIHTNDGACGTSVIEPTFPHFIALPPPNDYAAACFGEAPPCTATAPEVRAAVDEAGNLLMPMGWGGILASSDGVPVPRLLRTQFKSPLPFQVPDQIFIDSFTPEGGRLPPIFEPQFDPTSPDPTIVTLFGSADALYTVLRIGRFHGTCVGGGRDSELCSAAPDCPGGTCESSCVGDPSTLCASDAACGSDGPCGALFNFAPLLGDGPLVLPRPNLTPLEGFCQNTRASCTTDCGSDGPCVNYAMESLLAVPLEGLESSDDARSFTVSESIDGRDRNGDGDLLDFVVTITERETGLLQDLGAPAGCGLGPASGRAVLRNLLGSFRYPAVTAQGDLVAFLEAELHQNGCDLNGDTDRDDALPRVFRVGAGELSLGTSVVAEPEPVLDGAAIAVSSGRVFFRGSEGDTGRRRNFRLSIGAGAAEGNQGVAGAAISANKQFFAFGSEATNLGAGPDTVICGPPPNIPGDCMDLFVRDLVNGTIQVLTTHDGAEPNDWVVGIGGNNPARGLEMTPDGRHLAFAAAASNIVPNDDNGEIDVFVWDRVGGTVERVSVASDGSEADDGSTGRNLGLSDDGRFIAFNSNATNLIGASDTNGQIDVFVRDRCISAGVAIPACTPSTERVSIATDGSEGSGFDPRMSHDGRLVAFLSNSSNFAPTLDDNFDADVYLRDRLAGTTELMSLAVDGTSPNGSGESSTDYDMSADGRYFVFSSDAPDFVPPGQDTNGQNDAYLRDRLTGIVQRMSTRTDGAGLPGSDFGGLGAVSISRNGRFVAFESNLDFTSASPTASDHDDVFVRDRLTDVIAKATVRDDGSPSEDPANFGSLTQKLVPLDDGDVLFSARLSDLLLEPDTNDAGDIFLRTAEPTDPLNVDAALFPDGALDDIVLHVFDADSATLTVLCPSGPASVSEGSAAFLRPEAPTGTAACPAGSRNGDADLEDEVVHLWQGGGVESLGRAGAAVSLSATHVAALITESGEGVDYNGDGDMEDHVAQVHAVGATPGSWQNPSQAADRVEMAGVRAVFLTPEDDQGAVLNGDGDTLDRVLRSFDATTGGLLDPGQAGEEFVVGASEVTACGTRQLVAFRTSEAAQAENLNPESGDVDLLDDVLQVLDLETGTLVNPGQAVTPCQIIQCDPREPYRVVGSKVSFLTFEPDQNGLDLSGEGSTQDLVLQLYDFCTDTVTTIGRVAFDGSVDPLEVPEQSRVFLSPTGRCEASTGCDPTNPCAAGEICDTETCSSPGCQGIFGFCELSFADCSLDADCADFCDPGLGQCADSGLPCTDDTECSSACQLHDGFCPGTFDSCTGDDDCRTCETSDAPCASDADCSICVSAQPTTCADDADCPVGASCAPTTIVAASGILDFDSDGVPDDLDNCPRDFNPQQLDPDGDGVGAVCDAAPGATPVPSASPTPAPTPAPSPSPTPSATASPSPTPTPSPVLTPTPSPASDGRTRVGRSLLVKDRGGVPKKRRIVWVAQGSEIVTPGPQSADDPTLAGGRLRIVNPNTLEEQIFDLPASNWDGLGDPAGTMGYRYRDKSQSSGPCRKIVMRPGRVARADCAGEQIEFTLDEPTQDALAVSLTVGSITQCTLFGGDVLRDYGADPGTAGRFNAIDAPAPPACF